jgi:putative FmdB family regulatory protein
MYFGTTLGEKPMPTYEYRCQDCQQSFEKFLTYAAYGTTTITCPRCGSALVQRQISRVRIARSEQSRLEAMADPDQLAGIEDDPRALGRLMRQMGSELDEEMGPEFDEVVSRLEKGQNPEEIEKDMPEIADSPGNPQPKDQSQA